MPKKDFQISLLHLSNKTIKYLNFLTFIVPNYLIRRPENIFHLLQGKIISVKGKKLNNCDIFRLVFIR